MGKENMGFRITIQAGSGKSLYISNGYGDFSAGPLDKLARKYRHTGTYDDQDGCFEVEIGNVDDLADTLAEIQQIAEENIVDRNERELHEELFDFALEVVCQYGYVVGDGLYATGGSSVIESAFSILRRYGMLDKDGYCSIVNQPTINENNRGENDEKE